MDARYEAWGEGLNRQMFIDLTEAIEFVNNGEYGEVIDVFNQSQVYYKVPEPNLIVNFCKPSRGK